jgi:hypothetical protein
MSGSLPIHSALSFISNNEHLIQKSREARCQRLTPIILATQEAEIKRIMVRGQSHQKKGDLISKIPTTKRG